VLIGLSDHRSAFFSGFESVANQSRKKGSAPERAEELRPKG
jgi:hypothetical protein